MQYLQTYHAWLIKFLWRLKSSNYNDKSNSWFWIKQININHSVLILTQRKSSKSEEKAKGFCRLARTEWIRIWQGRNLRVWPLLMVLQWIRTIFRNAELKDPRKEKSMKIILNWEIISKRMSRWRRASRSRVVFSRVKRMKVLNIWDSQIQGMNPTIICQEIMTRIKTASNLALVRDSKCWEKRPRKSKKKEK